MENIKSISEGIFRIPADIVFQSLTVYKGKVQLPSDDGEELRMNKLLLNEKQSTLL